MKFVFQKRRISLNAGLQLFGVLVAALLSVTVAIAVFSSNQADRQSEQIERAQVANALELHLDKAVNDATFVAIWDEVITRVNVENNKDWASENITGYMTQAFQKDFSFVLRHDKSMLVGSSQDGPVDEARFQQLKNLLNPVLDALLADVEKGKIASFIDPQRVLPSYYDILDWQRAIWRNEIMMIEGSPAVVTAMRVVPFNDQALTKFPPVIVVNITMINDVFLAKLASSLSMEKVSWLENAGSKDGGIGIPVTSPDPELGTNDTIGHLYWQPRHPGTAMAKSLFPMIAVIISVFAGFAALLLTSLISASRKLSEREAAERHAARHDSLTGLPNRLDFKESLEALARGSHFQPFSVALIDMDNFKNINDTLGHDIGNALLIAAAHAMKKTLREDDLIARLGGDEFAVLRKASTNDEASKSLGEDIQAIFSNPLEFASNSMTITVSCGVVRQVDSGTNVEDTMRKADIALYRAKEDGRNKSRVFSEEMEVAVQRRHAIDTALRAALGTNELKLVYQPLVGAKNRKTAAVEALMRWTSLELGPVPPSEFIPVAEKTGMIIELGRFAMRRAFTDLKEMSGIDLTFNVSPVQIKHPHFINDVREILAETGADPRRIEIEITETVLMEESDRLRHILLDLKDIGFRIALDDFGTGYSSLGYLQSFAFDTLKIDRSFVKNIGRSVDTNTIIYSVVAMARSLGMTVVAEGVETEDQYAFLKAAGCALLQGYLFSRPVPLEDLARKREPLKAIA